MYEWLSLLCKLAAEDGNKVDWVLSQQLALSRILRLVNRMGLMQVHGISSIGVDAHQGQLKGLRRFLNEIWRGELFWDTKYIISGGRGYLHLSQPCKGVQAWRLERGAAGRGEG